MTTDLRHATSLRREVEVGALAGLVAAAAMGGYAMIAYLISDKGLFTPLHQLASLFLSPDAMETSMASAGDGKSFEISMGAAVLGAALHLVLGLVYGAVFGALVGRHKLEAYVLAAAGFVWGMLVLVLNAFVSLPAAAALFDVDDVGRFNPIADFAHFTSWGHFGIEHAIFGLVLGLLVAQLTPREPGTQEEMPTATDG